MRENRPYGSEGGESGSTGLPYPYRPVDPNRLMLGTRWGATMATGWKPIPRWRQAGSLSHGCGESLSGLQNLGINRGSLACAGRNPTEQNDRDCCRW
jgi:hypothetical protein